MNLMWTVIGEPVRENDPDGFYGTEWRLKIQHADGRRQTTRVRVDGTTMGAEEGPDVGGALREVADAIKTRGKSVIEANAYRDNMPTLFTFIRDSRGPGVFS